MATVEMEIKERREQPILICFSIQHSHTVVWCQYLALSSSMSGHCWCTFCYQTCYPFYRLESRESTWYTTRKDIHHELHLLWVLKVAKMNSPLLNFGVLVVVYCEDFHRVRSTGISKPLVIAKCHICSYQAAVPLMYAINKSNGQKDSSAIVKMRLRMMACWKSCRKNWTSFVKN